jgi:malate synthase
VTSLRSERGVAQARTVLSGPIRTEDPDPPPEDLSRVRLREPPDVAGAELLTAGALRFLLALHDRFEVRRQELLSHRGAFRRALQEGRAPDFPVETAALRLTEWKVASPPADLRDRRVEITGPVDRKMVINGLNSGASVFMADFEDAHSPTWSGTMAGQRNLRDAVRRQIEYTGPEGRAYRLVPSPATLMVRPRGWHLDERHLEVDGRPVSASLFDFGVFFFHNARELVDRGTGPYFYLPKMEHYLEARLWNDVFRTSQEALALPSGTVRATVLIETLPAAFQMDEILFELREHSAGLNCGRWDYLFSFLKQYRDDPRVLFPDRALLGMTTPFLTAYSHLLIQTCHRRGAHAMGGMAAQIPIKGDPGANAAAMGLVRADKEREVRAGHDGTWVAHPALVPIAREVFDGGMPGPNQVDAPRSEPPIAPSQLVILPTGPITEDGVRRNTRVALRYLEAWLRGVGCVPIDHLMEDAATVEIARSQLWQWIHHGALLSDGTPVAAPLFRSRLADQVRELRSEGGGPVSATIDRAAALLDRVVTAGALEEFITVSAYNELEDPPGSTR